MTSPTVRPFDTPHGEARLHVRRPRRCAATLLLGHGAGGGVEARDLVALAETLPAQGFGVVLLEQPWRVAGRKVATAPATLDTAVRCAVRELRLRTPLVVGGRSAGARSAARTAREVGAVSALALSFPLHPPGADGPSRLAELASAGVPTLVVQGQRDALGRPEEFPDGLPGVDMAVIPAADHEFKVPARGEITQADALAIVVESVLEWLVREVVGNRLSD